MLDVLARDEEPHFDVQVESEGGIFSMLGEGRRFSLSLEVEEEIVDVIFERLDRHGERMDEVLNSLAFVNTKNAVVMSQLCDVVDSLKELLQEVGEIKTCRDGKVCGRSVGIR